MLALIVTILAVGAGVWVLRDDGGGELALSRPTTRFVGPPITAEDPAFHLSVELESHPGQAVRILEVETLTSPNVEYLGAVVAWPREPSGYDLGVGPSFPPSDLSSHHTTEEPIPPAETSHVPSGWDNPAEITVVVGFRLMSAGVGAMNGVRVIYEVAGARKTEIFRQAMIACLPSCKAQGSEEPGFEDRVLTQFGLLPEE